MFCLYGDCIECEDKELILNGCVTIPPTSTVSESQPFLPLGSMFIKKRVASSTWFTGCGCKHPHMEPEREPNCFF